jgi:hypothetical protein
MAWSFDAGEIHVGETFTWWLGWNSWPGLEHIVARPTPYESGSLAFWLETEIEVHTVRVRKDIIEGHYTYHIDVTNHGPDASRYEILGVGL